ncbi:hypothetical protein WR25_10567 [Diploscapter pachys]|uniref:5-formyltetrahydrofolate cyclo-ligase n=1 Tax=Diploscapter pachys TaxID=2018661 RepID=A0A2A2JTG6_9BILA|nr:hypothetical protein WR25_10567 [Diploscapter pachys]
MTANPLKEVKKAMRKEMGKLLAEVPQQSLEEQTKVVLQKVLSADRYKNAKRVSVFVSTVGEIQTDEVIIDALTHGKEVFIPHFIKGNDRMLMRKVPDLAAFKNLQPTLWGIRQPGPDCTWSLYEESGPLDLVLQPCVAITEKGERLGHGKGYYDRFLTEHKTQFGKHPYKVVIAIKEQVVEKVPLSEFDVNVDLVLHP